MHTIKHPKDSDTHLIFKLPDINGTPYNGNLGNWDLSVWVTPKRVSHIMYKEGKSTSLGEIPTSIKINEDSIELFIKSSKVPFGQGPLMAKMSIYESNENFIDNIQVIRTFTNKLNIEIV